MHYVLIIRIGVSVKTSVDIRFYRYYSTGNYQTDDIDLVAEYRIISYGAAFPRILFGELWDESVEITARIETLYKTATFKGYRLDYEV